MLTTENLESSHNPSEITHQPDSDGAATPADAETTAAVQRATKPASGKRTRNVETWRTGAVSIIIGCFVVLTLASLPPESETSETVDRLLEPAVRVTGIQQNWGVFSPNPSQVEARTHAILYFEDGSSTEWRPRPNNVFDSSRSERWRKWESRVRLDINEVHWPVAAQFVADQYANAPSPVARIRLVRTWSDVPLPTEAEDDREISEYHFFEWNPTTSTGIALTRSDQLSTEPSS